MTIKDYQKDYFRTKIFIFRTIFIIYVMGGLLYSYICVRTND